MNSYVSCVPENDTKNVEYLSLNDGTVDILISFSLFLNFQLTQTIDIILKHFSLF